MIFVFSPHLPRHYVGVALIRATPTFSLIHATFFSDDLLRKRNTHGHDSHSEQYKESTPEKILLVHRYYVTETDSCQGNKWEVESLKVIPLCFPNWEQASKASRHTIGQTGEQWITVYPPGLQHRHQVLVIGTCTRFVLGGTPIVPLGFFQCHYPHRGHIPLGISGSVLHISRITSSMSGRLSCNGMPWPSCVLPWLRVPVHGPFVTSSSSSGAGRPSPF